MFLMIERDTGRAFFASLFAATYIGPAAVLVTVSGALTDHLPKRSVIFAAYLAWAGLAVCFAITADHLWGIYLVAIAFAIVSQIKGAASSSARPLLVPKEKLSRANALGQLGGIISQGLGVLILPFIFLRTFGASALAAACVPLFVAAALQIAKMRSIGANGHDVGRALESNRERFLDAWRDLVRDHVSYLSMWFYVLMSVIAYVVITLVPRYASDVLGLPEEIGVFVVLPAVFGIWLALRFDDAVIRRLSALPAVVLSFVALSGGVLLLGFVSWIATGVADLGAPLGAEALRIVVTVALAIVIGFAYMFLNVADNAIINTRIPKEIQGRIFSGQNVLSNLAAVPPILLAGAGADILGAAPVLVITALVSGGTGAFILTRYGVRRVIESFVQHRRATLATPAREGSPSRPAVERRPHTQPHAHQ
jgi:MFS family permease